VGVPDVTPTNPGSSISTASTATTNRRALRGFSPTKVANTGSTPSLSHCVTGKLSCALSSDADPTRAVIALLSRCSAIGARQVADEPPVVGWERHVNDL
jgi:hypothetical protein